MYVLLLYLNYKSLNKVYSIGFIVVAQLQDKEEEIQIKIKIQTVDTVEVQIEKSPITSL